MTEIAWQKQIRDKRAREDADVDLFGRWWEGLDLTLANSEVREIDVWEGSNPSAIILLCKFNHLSLKSPFNLLSHISTFFLCYYHSVQTAGFGHSSTSHGTGPWCRTSPLQSRSTISDEPPYLGRWPPHPYGMDPSGSAWQFLPQGREALCCLTVCLTFWSFGL